jgi:hypothetical protein
MSTFRASLFALNAKLVQAGARAGDADKRAQEEIFF